MMRTKLTLFVTVLAAALFWMGCASTPRIYQLADLEEIDGIYHHTDNKKSVTGKIIKDGQDDKFEFNLKDGIKHGRYRRWLKKGHNGIGYVPLEKGDEWLGADAVYRMGELVKFQNWWNYDVQNRSPQLRLKVWKGSAAPWQSMHGRWNQDGTPTKEHALTLNTSGQTHNEADTVEKNGKYYLKNSNKALTGRIVKMIQGQFYEVFEVKNGIKDGRHKRWLTSKKGAVVSADSLSKDWVYQSGKLIRRRDYWNYESQIPPYPWKDSPYPYQVRLNGWNRDGTPAEYGKEK